MDFLQQIHPNTISIKGNNKIYKINFETFIQQHIPLVALFFNTVKLYIEVTNTDNINEIKLISNYITLVQEARQEIDQFEKCYLIKDYQCDEKNIINTHIASINFYYNNYSTMGIFIETESRINNIKSLHLKFNDRTYTELDDIQLNYLCQPINNNMIYLPFTPNQKFIDFNHHGLVNFNSIDSIQLELTGFNPFNGKVKIHTIPFNLYRILGGFSGIAYSR
jgi:hypothetical protein